MSAGRRCRRQRGVAAVEMALISPLLFAIVGAILALGLSIYARAQMIEITYQAARVCAAALPTTVSGVAGCVRQQLASQLAVTNLVCKPTIGPATTQVLPITIPGPLQIYAVTATLTCSYGQLGLPLLALVSNSAPTAITISAQSTAPFIPGG